MKVKILITYKDLHPIINSDILIPIQTGRAIAKENFPNMIGDDTGENISDENNKFSELTAQYWAWKNYEQLGNPDYIGHMQYRRHFIFSETARFDIETPEEQINGFSVKFISKISDDYIRNIGLEDDNILKKISNTDIVAVKKADMTYLNCKNAKQDFLTNVPSARETDYTLLIDTVIKKHPEYKDAVERLENEQYRYFYHMFIMRRDLFFEYCDFVFPILFEIDSKIDYKNRGTRGGRVLGYLGEFLLSIFIFHKEREGKIIKEFYSTVVLDTKKFQNNPLQLPMNKQYYCYHIENKDFLNFLVSIASLDEHSSSKENILVFFEELHYEYIDYLNKLKLEKIKIYLICTKKHLDGIDKKFQEVPFLQVYALTHPFCEKIIYLSSNLIFCKKININQFKEKLYASKHPTIYTVINNNRNFYAYTENILGLKDGYNYLTDNILIADTHLTEYINNKLKDKFFNIKKQKDIINYCFSDIVTYLDENFCFECNYSVRKKYFTNLEYENAARECTILFFDLQNYNDCDYFALSLYMKYIKQTPFYEEFLFRNCHIKNFDKDIKALRNELEFIHFTNINRHFLEIESHMKQTK